MSGGQADGDLVEEAAVHPGIGEVEDRPKPGKPQTTDNAAILLAALTVRIADDVVADGILYPAG